MMHRWLTVNVCIALEVLVAYVVRCAAVAAGGDGCEPSLLTQVTALY